MIRTTRNDSGLKIEVVKDTTNQIVWQKFVTWNDLYKLPEVFAQASRVQERTELSTEEGE